MGSHINTEGLFQSDKYPTCPAGKVPLSVKDRSAQDLLWAYAQRRRVIDAEFADDLETALRAAGYDPKQDKRRDCYPVVEMTREIILDFDRGTLTFDDLKVKMREVVGHFALFYTPVDSDLWKLKLVAKHAYQFKLRHANFFLGGTKIDPFWEAIDDLPSTLLNEAHAEMVDEIEGWKAERSR
jgi:hypothetical protein